MTNILEQLQRLLLILRESLPTALFDYPDANVLLLPTDKTKSLLTCPTSTFCVNFLAAAPEFVKMAVPLPYLLLLIISIAYLVEYETIYFKLVK